MLNDLSLSLYIYIYRERERERHVLDIIGSGLGREYFGNVVTAFVWLWKHLAGIFVSSKTAFPKILDMAIFKNVCFCRTPLNKLNICLVHPKRTWAWVYGLWRRKELMVYKAVSGCQNWSQLALRICFKRVFRLTPCKDLLLIDIPNMCNVFFGR